MAHPGYQSPVASDGESCSVVPFAPFAEGDITKSAPDGFASFNTNAGSEEVLTALQDGRRELERGFESLSAELERVRSQQIVKQDKLIELLRTGRRSTSKGRYSTTSIATAPVPKESNDTHAVSAPTVKRRISFMNDQAELLSEVSKSTSARPASIVEKPALPNSLAPLMSIRSGDEDEEDPEESVEVSDDLEHKSASFVASKNARAAKMALKSAASFASGFEVGTYSEECSQMSVESLYGGEAKRRGNSQSWDKLTTAEGTPASTELASPRGFASTASWTSTPAELAKTSATRMKSVVENVKESIRSSLVSRLESTDVVNNRASRSSRRRSTLLNTHSSLDGGFTKPHVRAMFFLRRIVDSTAFAALCMCAILTNAVFIGVAADMTMRQQLDRVRGSSNVRSNALVLDRMEIGFCIFFTVELLFRFCSGPTYFFRGQDVRWNLFDSLLVLTCPLSKVMQALEFMGILRVVRMVRILRIIRVMRFFRSLRLMVYSIIHSMQSLLWVFLLLLFAMYLFSMFILTHVQDYLSEIGDGGAKENGLEETLVVNLATHFGTVHRCLISLFMTICGGKDWHELYTPLEEVSDLCGLAFLFYIFFVVFGVLNVVTGAFVDSMRQVSQKDHDAAIDGELLKAKAFTDDVTKIFEEADTDGSGTLSWEEFEAHLQDHRVTAYLQSLELDVSQARALFVLLDLDESDEVPIDKFIDGCMRMRGDAKSIDVNMLLYENEKILAKFTHFSDYCEEQFTRISQALGLRPNNLAQKSRRPSTAQNGLTPSVCPSPMPAYGSEAAAPVSQAITLQSTGSMNFNDMQKRRKSFHGLIPGAPPEGLPPQYAMKATQSIHAKSRLDNALNTLAYCGEIDLAD